MNEASSGNNRNSNHERALRSPSPALPHRFIFVDSPADFRDPAAIVVRIPGGVRSKQKLFAIYAKALRFPKYFGWNWDAFEECFADLSWLPPDRPIAIVHEELPFGPGGENRHIYIDVLRGITENRAIAERRSIQIIMPLSLSAEFSPSANEPR